MNFETLCVCVCVCVRVFKKVNYSTCISHFHVMVKKNSCVSSFRSRFEFTTFHHLFPVEVSVFVTDKFHLLNRLLTHWRLKVPQPRSLVGKEVVQIPTRRERLFIWNPTKLLTRDFMTLGLTKEISLRRGNQSDHVRRTFNPSAQV